MTWYRTGTVTVGNGNPVVTGAGTAWVANTSAGQAFLGPDARVYEIAAVVSDTQLTLVGAYVGASGAGQGYAILPTQSFIRDLALGAAELLGTFGAVRDGIGQGLIGDGVVATPGIRFAADQDTGIFRAGANAVGVAVGGTIGCLITGTGLGVGAVPGYPLHVQREGVCELHVGSTQADAVLGLAAEGSNGGSISYRRPNSLLVLNNAGNDAIAVTAAGIMLVGTLTPSTAHTVRRPGGEGAAIIGFGPVAGESHRFYVASAAGASSALTCYSVDKVGSTNRSINAAGTVNASGADYAEYMTKAPGCSTISAGEVCGVTAAGLLTRTWTDAIGFVVKSTDPAYVGGDSWARHLPPRPEQDEDETDAVFAARLAPWEAQLEAARQTVDRIAFSGQVPVAVSGSFAPGDYLIAAANGGGIKAIAVPEADISFDQYRRRLGRVWRALDDGRAWTDVQHG